MATPGEVGDLVQQTSGGGRVLTGSGPTDEERRDTCLWLAELATWHSGVVARLAGRFGSLSDALERPRHELAEVLSLRGEVPTARRSAPRGLERAADDGDDAVPDQRPQPPAPGEQEASEAAAWKAALARCAPSRAAQPPPGGIAVAFCEPGYPAGLRDLRDAPPALFVLSSQGEDAAREALARVDEAVRVAVVGTRRPSTYGLDMALTVSGDLVREDAVVVSGLAFGIDAAAHRGALEAAVHSQVCTVAVMAGGADVGHPRAHGTLRRRVLEQGLVVSEFVWGAPVRSWRFPARNRVMAAMSHCTVVVEGSWRSGALITARRAEDLGRLVLAVPGECGRRLTEGPHTLLREGAALCDSGASVAEAFHKAEERSGAVLPEPVRRWLRARGQEDAANVTHAERRMGSTAALAGSLRRGERKVLAVLDAGCSSLDQVVAATGMPSGGALAALGALEVQGLVCSDGHGAYRAARRDAPRNRR